MEYRIQLLHFLQEKGFENILTGPDGQFLQFTSVQDELQAMQGGLTCRDITNSTQLVLFGTDALDFLHRISTNSLKDLPAKGVKRTLFTNEKGRLLESVLVTHLGDSFLLIGHENKSKLLQYWLGKYIIADDVVVANGAKENMLVELRGEQLPALLILLFGDAAKTLRTNTAIITDYNMAPVWIIPDSENGTGSKYYIWAKNATMLQILSECLDKGNPYEFNLIGESAYEQYRLEHGIVSGKEIDDRFNPHEALLADAISFTKGCYIGQEVIARLDTYQKVQKSLRSFLIPEQISAPAMFTLYTPENEEVGTITSSVFSDRLKKTIGLGYIKRDFANQGTVVKAVNGKEHFRVTVQLPGKLHENLY